MNRFLKPFHLSFSALLDYLPAILGGIACFVAALFLANFISRLVSRYSLRRTKDPLIANFIGKIAWSVIFIIGCVLALGILGLGTISNKILAGAGITTFVVGFALKDIGENFLSGLVLAFSRPFRVGNLIECDGVKGVVKNMTMRQTTVETEDGKLIMIPNSAILSNPLTKYMNDDNNLRQEFGISVESVAAQKAIQVISDTICGFEPVTKDKRRPVKVIVDALSGDKVKLNVIYWLDSAAFSGSKSGTRSRIMLAVFEKLAAAGYKFSG